MSTRSAALAVCAAVLLPGSAPLYDGLGFPDEPYRYVPPRPGTSGAPATAASRTLSLNGLLTSPGLILNSGEAGPQVSLYVPPASFAVRASPGAHVTAVALEVTPVVPDGPAVPGTQRSNVYRVALTCPAGPVTRSAVGAEPRVTLRAYDPSGPDPVVAFRGSVTAAWRTLPTSRQGQDIFTAGLPGPGDVVLARAASVPPRSADGAGAALLAVPLALLLGLVVLLVRRRARTQPTHR